MNTCRECCFRKRIEGHPRRFFCQMKVQKYHTGTKCFVRLKDIACEDFIERDGIKELKLVLTYKWYDMIDSGEKPEEYRNRTTFYRRRLETGWSEPHLRWRKYDIVTFYRGYAKGRKTMSFKYGGCREGTGKEEWGAEPGKEYYVIKLGERIEHKNEPKLFEI